MRELQLHTRAAQRSRSLEEILMSETTKAAAWAVFQHHGGGGSAAGAATSSSYSRGGGSGIAAVGRATRFKIEAQMRNGGAHSESSRAAAVTSLCTTVNNLQWDAGSTLFDSYELDSLSKQFDQAFIWNPTSRNSFRLEAAAPPPAVTKLSSSSSSSSCVLDDESHQIADRSLTTSRVKSPFPRQRSLYRHRRHRRHHDLDHASRILPPSERMRDFVEDSYTLDQPILLQRPAKPIVENTAYRDDDDDDDVVQPTAAGTREKAQDDSCKSSPGRTTSSCMEEEESLEEETQEKEEEPPIKLFFAGQKAVGGGGGGGSFLQFAHTPNPLNLSQRKSRRSMDMNSSHELDSSMDMDDGSSSSARQSFQEKLRNFFHKARISPQESSSSMLPLHKSSSTDSSQQQLYPGARRPHPPGSPRKPSTSHELQDDSLFHYGWSYVEEAADDRADSVVDCRNLSSSKHKKLQDRGSFSFRSVGKKALQHSLPAQVLGGSSTSESQQQRQHHHQRQSSSDSTTTTSVTMEHEHHHVYYHHHLHHIVIHQKQQQLDHQDYEQLSLQQQQDIDHVRIRRLDVLPRNISLEEFKAASCSPPISCHDHEEEDAAAISSNFTTPLIVDET
ncbi:unnamed protein product [Sphagnum jensenii]|uniref:Uncharacterized protein n=1 Tax=Sphagnum jensenii TaxID=128206 RepID=A0ABP1BTM6_9BRYO